MATNKIETKEVEKDSKQYIVVQIGNEKYGIDICYVDNIVRMQKITRVPKAQVYFKGIINLRGEIVPVMSIRTKMGLEDDVFTNASRIIILKIEEKGSLGVIVDEVCEVVTLADSQIEKSNVNATHTKDSFISGVGKNGDQLISLLEINAIIDEKDNTQLFGIYSEAFASLYMIFGGNMESFTLDHVNEMYMDVLRELGNIGAGNATTSLANMINEQINMNVPKVELIEASKLGSAICPEDEIIVGIFLEVTRDIKGSMMFLMRMESAHYLVNRLMGRDPKNMDPFDEMDLSAMKEIGNIIAGAYLSALSGMTNLTIAPSVPYIAVDMAAAILSVPAIQFGQYGNNALLIETEFGSDYMIGGYFILMPEEDSYAKILESLGIQLQG